jgi:acyl carrier protein
VIETIATVLRDIAPEADLSSVDPDEPLRDELDLDSMDLQSLYAGLHNKLGIEIPEEDVPELATLTSMIAYLERKTS